MQFDSKKMEGKYLTFTLNEEGRGVKILFDIDRVLNAEALTLAEKAAYDK